MKKLVPAILLASLALVATNALPANAAITSITVTDGTGPAAVDTSTKLVYVGTTPTAPQSPEPGEDWNSSAGVAKVDPTAKKVVKSVVLSTIWSAHFAEYVADVKVSSFSNDLWVLLRGFDSNDGCWSRLYQLNKVSLATTRSYSLGCSTKIELDPTSQWAYLTEAPFYGDQGENAQLISAGTVVAINGATGALSRVAIPSPTSGIYSLHDHHEPTSIAFNRKNYGIYVVGQNTVWVYTTKLKLVKTTTLGYPVSSPLSTAANLTTNLIYVTDGKKVTELSGPTGNVTRTSVIGGGSTMVIDTSSNVLYLGTNTVKLSTLTSTGKQTYKVQAVDPATHARYWAASSMLYVTR